MFDLAALTRSVHDNGPTARVVIVAHEGSSPREAGTSMLVWATGQSGTIGGGALEWQAVSGARALLSQPRTHFQRIPLGPALGQCCGGAVSLVTEVFTAATLPHPRAGLVVRSLDGSDAPLTVRRLVDRARAQGTIQAMRLIQGWLVEPVSQPSRNIWIWGAGHVGRALVEVLAPLPDLQITWIDVAADRFPDALPAHVVALPAPDPAQAVALAPRTAEHFVLTFSHALDLEICHRLLSNGFATCGLIGSATKWARFRSRLAALGHAPVDIAAIECPIGRPDLGKHPQAIAIGVAAQLLAARPLALMKEHLG